jgi:hypothetical protein
LRETACGVGFGRGDDGGDGRERDGGGEADTTYQLAAVDAFERGGTRHARVEEFILAELFEGQPDQLFGDRAAGRLLKRLAYVGRGAAAVAESPDGCGGAVQTDGLVRVEVVDEHFVGQLADDDAFGACSGFGRDCSLSHRFLV